MAVRKDPAVLEQKVERQFPSKGAAEEWVKKEKIRIKQQGMSTRYDIKFNSGSGTWTVILYYWVGK